MKKSVLLAIALLFICSIGAISIFFLTRLNINEIALNTKIQINDIEKNNINIELDNDYTVSANVPIFMYHWVRDDVGDYPYPENIVKPSELRKQMEYLKENNYDVLFVSELDKLQHYNKPAILTFDDGWVDVYYEAFPLAKELNMKICMYVITDLVGTNAYCNTEQLQEMRDSGLVEIDSHTLSHPRLADIASKQLQEELENSKVYLKEKLNIDSKVICYPYGSCSNNVVDVAKQNYKYGLLMDGGVFKYNSNTSNLYEIERIYATRSMSLDRYKNYCESSYVKIN